MTMGLLIYGISVLPKQINVHTLWCGPSLGFGAFLMGRVVLVFTIRVTHVLVTATSKPHLPEAIRPLSTPSSLHASLAESCSPGREELRGPLQSPLEPWSLGLPSLEALSQWALPILFFFNIWPAKPFLVEGRPCKALC